VQSNRLEDNKWTVITAKCHRKGFLSKNLTEANNTYPLSTVNHYEQLTNLQDTQANYITLKIQEENNVSNIPNHDHQTKLLHQSRGRTQRTRKENREDFQIYHIPTLLSGKIGNKRMETVSNVGTYMNSVTKNMLRQHKITMIGDSFLRRIRENVELSLSNKFGIYSMVKLGCELTTLQHDNFINHPKG